MQPQLIAGRYQVLRAIGRGGMGTVWLCRDEILGREVAVKQIGSLPGESATETRRALREARSAAAFNHPNAVAVYDVVDHDARPWLVMEYVEGQTLADEISRDGKLSPGRVADVGSQLASALARAHERRIVHRDIKPGNVLIDKAGRPKISDFGIARGHGDDQLTAIGFVTGTPGYLSPELARGEDPHPASDVWALGATLYAAVEGRSPYEPRSNPIALLRTIATERPRPMTHAGALRPAIDAMMHEDPARRWDMATSAQRLGGIALAAAAVMPVVEQAGTAVMPVVEQAGTAMMPRLEPTRSLEAAAPPVGPTQRLAPAAPPVESTQRFEAAAQPVESTQLFDVAEPTLDPTRRFDVAARVAAVAADQRPETEGAGDSNSGAPVPPAYGRTSGRRGKPLLYAALLVVALGVAFLLTQLGDPGGTTAPPGKASAASPAKTTVPVAPKISEPPTGNEQGKNDAPASGTDKKLEGFVTSYYSDVTKDTDRTWDQLSPGMQDAAGGREGYDRFWRTIDKVKVNRVRANDSGTSAVVNLTFTRDDGTRSTESHQFTFITDDEGYLIDGDQFLGG